MSKFKKTLFKHMMVSYSPINTAILLGVVSAAQHNLHVKSVFKRRSGAKAGVLDPLPNKNNV